jgi:hypothetical protein
MRRSFAEAAKMPYSERMAKLGRPVSPHVTIYAFPVVALSSITVRVTGVLLTIGTTGIAGKENRCHGRDRYMRRIRVYCPDKMSMLRALATRACITSSC